MWGGLKIVKMGRPKKDKKSPYWDSKPSFDPPKRGTWLNPWTTGLWIFGSARKRCKKQNRTPWWLRKNEENMEAKTGFAVATLGFSNWVRGMQYLSSKRRVEQNKLDSVGPVLPCCMQKARTRHSHSRTVGPYPAQIPCEITAGSTEIVTSPWLGPAGTLISCARLTFPTNTLCSRYSQAASGIKVLMRDDSLSISSSAPWVTFLAPGYAELRWVTCLLVVMLQTGNPSVHLQLWLLLRSSSSCFLLRMIWWVSWWCKSSPSSPSSSSIIIISSNI